MQTTDKLSLDQLVSKLKNQDVTYSRLSKRFYIFYLIFIPVLIALAIIEFSDTKDMNIVFWASSMSIAFGIFALLFKSYFKEYGHVDYAKSTMEMLEGAVYRYQPFQTKTIWVLLALIFVDLGLVFRISDRSNFLQTQLIFISILVVAIIAGLAVWYIKYKPIRDNAMRLIKELQE